MNPLKRVHFTADGQLLLCDGCGATRPTRSEGDTLIALRAMQAWIESHQVCVGGEAVDE